MFLKGLFNFNAINCDDQHLNNFICFNCKSVGTKCKTNRELGVCWKVASRTQTEGEHRDLFTCLRKEEQIDKYGGRMRSMVLAPPLMEVPDESPEIHSFPPVSSFSMFDAKERCSKFCFKNKKDFYR